MSQTSDMPGATRRLLVAVVERHPRPQYPSDRIVGACPPPRTGRRGEPSRYSSGWKCKWACETTAPCVARDGRCLVRDSQPGFP